MWDFSEWLLSVGDGTAPVKNFKNVAGDGNFIEIPNTLLIKNYEDPISAIINKTYLEFTIKYCDCTYIKERMIVTPTNDTIDLINKRILWLVPEE